jgi:hypothetical protein
MMTDQIGGGLMEGEGRATTRAARRPPAIAAEDVGRVLRRLGTEWPAVWLRVSAGVIGYPTEEVRCRCAAPAHVDHPYGGLDPLAPPQGPVANPRNRERSASRRWPRMAGAGAKQVSDRARVRDDVGRRCSHEANR